ncbi:MAG TPA: hypothetical protein VIM65_02825 [Cyclobacteriaceae bacterium]
MKNNILSKIVFIFLCSLFSCSKSLPVLDGIDLKEWNTDKNACTGKRLAMKDALTNQKEKLLGLNEMEIVTLLGKPDGNELYKRNQKFYYYAIQPSKECNLKTQNAVLQLVVRFTAMGVANEVSIE